MRYLHEKGSHKKEVTAVLWEMQLSSCPNCTHALVQAITRSLLIHFIVDTAQINKDMHAGGGFETAVKPEPPMSSGVQMQQRSHDPRCLRGLDSGRLLQTICRQAVRL